jgi:P-type E1-E2 ATPase
MKVTVLTGDRVERAIAAGFDSAYGGLSPLDKARLIAQWEDGGQRCLFVGDGINDAAALGRATSSIALASGAELAGANAQATLVTGDLTVIPWAVELSRRALRLIRTNLLWAAAYNAVGIAVAATGYLHPIAAAMLMVGSSLIITARSIRFVQSEIDGERCAANTAVGAPSLPELETGTELVGSCCCQ